MRFQIFRSSKLKFNISRYFSGIICGGLAVSLGYVIFCCFVSFLFPNVTKLSPQADIDPYFSFDFFKTLLGVFLYGAFWSMPAMFLTSFLKNKYIIMCVPLFFKYGISQTIQKLSQNVFSDPENINYDLLKFIEIINPDGLIRLAQSPEQLWILINFGILSAIFFVGYMIFKRMRIDCSE